MHLSSTPVFLSCKIKISLSSSPFRPAHECSRVDGYLPAMISVSAGLNYRTPQGYGRIALVCYVQHWSDCRQTSTKFKRRCCIRTNLIGKPPLSPDDASSAILNFANMKPWPTSIAPFEHCVDPPVWWYHIITCLPCIIAMLIFKEIVMSIVNEYLVSMRPMK